MKTTQPVHTMVFGVIIGDDDVRSPSIISCGLRLNTYVYSNCKEGTKFLNRVGGNWKTVRLAIGLCTIPQKRESSVNRRKISFYHP